jgi:DNA-binding GntR family transcriptional regulator
MSASEDITESGRPSLVDGAELALRNWLAPGRYRQGDRLPPELEIATMLGVSRGTLRSALQRLEETGEIVRRQGSGTFVGRMTMPSAFDERLERLEPYSSVAARRGVSLAAIDVQIDDRAVGPDVGAALGLDPDRTAITVTRTLLADDEPVAAMFDVVHPAIALPDTDELHTTLCEGQMLLDVLIDVGVSVTYAQTRVIPVVLTSRGATGKRLAIRGTAAGLELEELIFAGRDERVAYSRDLFAPDWLEIMVMRSLDSPQPARVTSTRASAGARRGHTARRRRRAG